MFPSHKLRCYEDSCTCHPGYVYQECFSLNYQQNDLIIKHTHLPLYWTASPNGCINFRPSNESSKEGEGWQSHFVTLLFHFSTLHHLRDGWVWAKSDASDFLTMALKWGRECQGMRLPSQTSFCFARLLFSCHDFWILLRTQPGHTEVSHHIQTGPETVRLSYKSTLVQLTEADPWKGSPGEITRTLSFYVMIHFTDSQGAGELWSCWVSIY